MRIRKYRVYDSYNKKYVSDLKKIKMDLSTGEISWSLLQQGDIWGEKNSGLILEDYTGTEDKNKKEIYEGDIVRTPFDDLPRKLTYFISYGEYIVHDVYDCGETIVIGYHGVKGKDHFLLDDGDVLEVIGNIHESPELLK